MAARDDYPAIAVHSRWPGREGEECKRALEEIDRLRRWKAEAECVIEEWDTLWEEAGCPRKLGDSKAGSLREALKSDGVI